MKSNYNDIIDVILTLTEDESISSNIAICGSIVPYIVAKKESNEIHMDFYILVKQKKMNLVRNKIKKLSLEYDFDFVSDSKKYGNGDYGFKVKYEGTAIGFFPYSLVDNNLCIKTYAKMKDQGKVRLKKKVISGVEKSDVIRAIPFNEDRTLIIMSPEFILSEIESRDKNSEYTTKETFRLLDKMCDYKILEKVREKVDDTKIYIETKSIVNSNLILSIILGVLLVILIIVAILCFK